MIQTKNTANAAVATAGMTTAATYTTAINATAAYVPYVLHHPSLREEQLRCHHRQCRWLLGD